MTWPADVPCAIGACDSSCLPRCEAASVEVLEVSIRNDGSPWQLGMPNERCACESDIECWAEVIDDHVVQLQVERCGAPDTASCACEPWTFAECEMPLLDEGMWRVVEEDGLDLFGPVQVAPADSSIELTPPRWQSPTINPQYYLDMTWPPEPSSSREVCFAPNENNTLSAEVEACGSCAHSVLGSCSMVAEGEQLILTTSAQTPITIGGIFCESCEWRPRPCGRPVAPGVYQLSVDGVDRGEVELGADYVCVPPP
ncbi:MAG: hypothetical protein ACI9KE_005837 [Polyangiales bacterium]